MKKLFLLSSFLLFSIFAFGQNNLLVTSPISASPGGENVHVGIFAGYSSIAGSNRNSFVGFSAGGQNTLGSNNSFFGRRAGISNLTGNGNSFFGSDAGFTNTTADSSTMIGAYAGYNSNAKQNTFVGSRAGYSNTSGTDNVYLGDNAGYSSNAIENTFVGGDAGFYNTTGSKNVFMGMNVASNNTTGTQNVAIGTRAAYGGNGAPNTPTSIGNGGVFVGYNAGYKNAGDRNVFIGQTAGYQNVSGIRNVMIGFEAGYSTTSSFNTFLGDWAGIGTTTGGENTFIGESAGQANTTAVRNTFLGKGSGNLSTTGGGNVALGYVAGFTNQTGIDNLFVGSYSDAMGIIADKLQRSAAIGPYAKVSINDAIVLGDYSNDAMKVGIGVHDPKYRLDVKGVVNMRAVFNSPSLKINDKNFLELDEQGQFVLNTFKMKYSNANDWSDKVFEKNYKMLTIKDLEQFIATNKHLPNVPSANEVVTKGIEIDKMTAKLLEKIEELTLYVIDLEKKNTLTNIELQQIKKQIGVKK